MIIRIHNIIKKNLHFYKLKGIIKYNFLVLNVMDYRKWNDHILFSLNYKNASFIYYNSYFISVISY